MREVIHSDVPLGAMSQLNIDGMKVSSDSSKVMLIEVEEVNLPRSFLDLPREIRDQIYSLMFLSDGPIYPSKARAGISEYLGLLRTNQLIYSEVVEMLYGRNIFQIRGEPRWKTPDFVNLLSSQRRGGFSYRSMWAFHTSQICLARLYLRKLYIPSHNISLDRLKHLFSLLKYFPNLEWLKVVYIASSGVKDMVVVNVCRLFRDGRPLVENFALCKRIRYSEAEDISWMLREKPYMNWTSISDAKDMHMWKNQDGELRQAVVVAAPQSIPE
jgi:hypothetical protein